MNSVRRGKLETESRATACSPARDLPQFLKFSENHVA